MSARVWITWERQRRSRVLSEHFECTFHEIVEEGAMRYPRSILRTLRVLVRERPATLIVQNPSMILATVATLWGLVTRTFVIVDRHTTFPLSKKNPLNPRRVAFKALHRFTLRFADLTIVTNDFLADLVEGCGGTAFVLPDKLPDLEEFQERRYPVSADARNVFLISSFATDEPIQEVIEGLSIVEEPPIHLYVSGNLKRAPAALVDSAPPNVTFTDYLPDADFNSLLCTADMVAVLTTMDHTMLCGCYEAVAAKRPLITSDKKVLRDYFEGAYFVDNSAPSIAAVLAQPSEEVAAARERIRSLGKRIRRTWDAEAEKLSKLIAGHE